MSRRATHPFAAVTQPWMLGWHTAMLMIEAQHVIGLRLLALSAGGAAAQQEAALMVDEKVRAAVHSSRLMITGGAGGPARVVSLYRRRVRANRKRLVGPG